MPFSQHSGSNSPGWAAHMSRCPLHSVWVDSQDTHTHTGFDKPRQATYLEDALLMLTPPPPPPAPNQAVPLMSSHLTHSLWQPTRILASEDAFHILQPYIRLLTPHGHSSPNRDLTHHSRLQPCVDTSSSCSGSHIQAGPVLCMTSLLSLELWHPWEPPAWMPNLFCFTWWHEGWIIQSKGKRTAPEIVTLPREPFSWNVLVTHMSVLDHAVKHFTVGLKQGLKASDLGRF